MRPTNPVTEERWAALRDQSKYTWFAQEQADVTAYVDTLRATVATLLAGLPRCAKYECENIATRAHPTAALGDYNQRCDEHPGLESTKQFGFDAEAYDFAWAPIVRALAKATNSDKKGDANEPATPLR